MSEGMVQRIARWAVDYDIAAIAPPSVERIKHSILDSLGCAFITRSEDCVTPILRYADETAGVHQATIIGGGKAPLALATLVNGTLIRAIDYNDHLAMDPNDGSKLGGHPSDNLAGILAVAEYQDRSGRDLLSTLLMSYDLYGRFNKLLTPDLPWDHTTAFGFTIPAAAGKLMGLSVSQMANAIALSGAQSATLGVVRRGQLSHSKFLASSLVAHRAVEAVQLAAFGATGPMSLFENSRGFAKGVFGRADGYDNLVAPLTPLHMVEGVTIKAYPGMDTSQAASEAAVTLSTKHKLSLNDITSIELVMSDHPMAIAQASDPERRRPESRETADHSFYYLVAVALIDGELTPRQFTDGRWHDRLVRSVMDRMTIRSDPAWKAKAPGGFPCTITLKANGREETADVAFAKGHAQNKMTRDEVIAKFRSCAARILTPTRTDDIIAAVCSLETLTSVRELTKLLGTQQH